MRITLSSSIRDMTYYLKQPKTMCEMKLIEFLAKSPQLINSLKRYSNHPIIRKNTHRGII